jgi:hypothetical protein
MALSRRFNDSHSAHLIRQAACNANVPLPIEALCNLAITLSRNKELERLVDLLKTTEQEKMENWRWVTTELGNAVLACCTRRGISPMGWYRMLFIESGVRSDCATLYILIGHLLYMQSPHPLTLRSTLETHDLLEQDDSRITEDNFQPLRSAILQITSELGLLSSCERPSYSLRTLAETELLVLDILTFIKRQPPSHSSLIPFGTLASHFDNTKHVSGVELVRAALNHFSLGASSSIDYCGSALDKRNAPVDLIRSLLRGGDVTEASLELLALLTRQPNYNLTSTPNHLLITTVIAAVQSKFGLEKARHFLASIEQKINLSPSSHMLPLLFKLKETSHLDQLVPYVGMGKEISADIMVDPIKSPDPLIQALHLALEPPQDPYLLSAILARISKESSECRLSSVLDFTLLLPRIVAASNLHILPGSTASLPRALPPVVTFLKCISAHKQPEDSHLVLPIRDAALSLILPTVCNNISSNSGPLLPSTLSLMQREHLVHLWLAWTRICCRWPGSQLDDCDFAAVTTLSYAFVSFFVFIYCFFHAHRV